MIVIVDYKLGNSGSIANMLKKIGYSSLITSDIREIESAKKLILPGVGAFDKAMVNMKELNLTSLLTKKVIHEKTPILGICLGMQMLAVRSEEGTLPGLGCIDAISLKFNFNDKSKKLKIPHMGWNTITLKKKHQLFDEMYDESRFYFVHSYAIHCNDEADVLTTTHYGQDFVSSFAKQNIFGVQFHPEKSHKFGMKLLENFAKI